jgi:hypothetical protein
MNAIISHGVLPATRVLLDEPAILVQSLTITPQRTEQRYKSGSRATVGVTETDPLMDLAFQGIIMEYSGLADVHPGTQLLTLANFQTEIHGFDIEDGIIICRDPARTLDAENPDSISFTATHFPFLTDPVAALAILGLGDDDGILATAVTPGVQGNGITFATAIDSTTNRTGLTAAASDGAVVVTSGDKRRMTITVAGTPLTLEPSGETSAGNDAVEWPVWTLGGIPIAEAENLEDPTFPFGYLRAKFSGWEYLVATSSEDQVGGIPSSVPGLGPSDWPDVLVENFTAATATIAQAIAAANATPDLPVTLSLADGDGTLALTAGAPVTLAGGQGGPLL